MSTILDYCWQEFRPVVRSRLTVDDLVQLTRERKSSLFVLHDESAERSALVFPERVLNLIAEFGFEGSSELADCGLYEFLGFRQLVIPQDAPAIPTLKMAFAVAVDAILALDDSGLPCGLLIPSSLRERLPDTYLAREHLSGMIPDRAGYDVEAVLVEIDRLVKDLGRDHVSEQLNFLAPEPRKCSGDGGHTVSHCPCPYHPKATCGLQSVVSE